MNNQCSESDLSRLIIESRTEGKFPKSDFILLKFFKPWSSEYVLLWLDSRFCLTQILVRRESLVNTWLSCLSVKCIHGWGINLKKHNQKSQNHMLWSPGSLNSGWNFVWWFGKAVFFCCCILGGITNWFTARESHYSDTWIMAWI